MAMIKKFFSTLLMGLMFCLCVFGVACNQEVEGTYKFSKMTYIEGGMQIELEAGEEFMGMITLSESFMMATLNKDGTAILVTNTGDGAETENGTWKAVEDGKIELTFEGEPVICDCNGKTLTIESEGSKIVLKK